MADSRDIVVSVNVIRDPRGAVIQTQLIKNEPPYVRAGIVTTIVGKDGSLIYTGSGVPSNELGVFTDLYIDNVAPNNFYQKDANDVWVLKGNLQGGKGDDGREVLIQNNGTYIQWQYDGDETWTNIVEVATLKGDTGSNIELQKGITHIQWRVVGDIDWINLIAIADLKGADGRGIVSFDLINTVGKTKTYRLLYTDATYVDINIVDGNDGNDGTGAYQIYVVGGGTLSEAEFNAAITLIPSHIADETIHHTIEELNLLYSDINHNHNLNDLTEKSYNSLTDKPDLSSLHTHANKEDLDNYDPDNFEPANSNIQEHIADTDIHIDSSSELGEAINESTHSLLLWNGLKALKVTFARMKTWIGSYFFAIGGNTFGAKKLIGSVDNQDFGIITNNLEMVTVTKDGNVGISTTTPDNKLTISGGSIVIDNNYGYRARLTSGTSVNLMKYDTSNNALIGPNNELKLNGNFTVQVPNNGNVIITGGAADSSSAIGTRINTLNTLVTAGSKIISFQNKNSEKAFIGYNGSAYFAGNVGIDTSAPKSKLQVAGGIQCGDDTAAASSDKVGTIRQRDVNNITKLEFARNNNGTYEWEQINDKLSLDQSTPQTINGNVNINGSVNPVTTDVNQSTTPSVNASQTAAILQDGSAFTGTDYIMPTNNVAVKIVASAAHTMGDFTIRVKSSATLTSTTATLTGYLYSDNAGSPGTLLATGTTIRHGSITTSYQELSLGTQYNMVSGTTYWLVIRWSSAPTGGDIILDSNVSSNLGATSADATTWTLTNVQLRYRLRGRTYYGINAFSTNNIGVRGESTNNYGIYGTSTNNVGTFGLSTNYYGVYGLSTNNIGVFGLSTNYYGVYGLSTNNIGVFGISTNSFGVSGNSANSYAGYFIRNTQTPTSSVSVLYAYQQHASNTNSVFDIRQNGTGDIIRGFSNTTQTFSVTAAGLGIFAKGVQIGDNTDVASSANKGILRYRENAGGSFFEICMKKQDGSYTWASIVSYQ